MGKRHDGEAKGRIAVHVDQLRPTQFTVGVDDVRQQVQKIEAFLGDGRGRGGDKDKGLKEMIAVHTVPVVMGPRGRVFLVDRHHFCRALWESDIPDRRKIVRCKVVSDQSR